MLHEQVVAIMHCGSSIRSLISTCLLLITSAAEDLKYMNSTGNQTAAIKFCATRKGNWSLPAGKTSSQLRKIHNILNGTIELKSAWISKKINYTEEITWIQGDKIDRKVHPEGSGHTVICVSFINANRQLQGRNCWTKRSYYCSKENFVKEKKHWLEAEKACRRWNTSLLTIETKHLADTNCGVEDGWLGGTNLATSELGASHWDNDINESASGECVVVNQRGKWEPVECFSNHAVICTKAKSTGRAREYFKQLSSTEVYNLTATAITVTSSIILPNNNFTATTNTTSMDNPITAIFQRLLQYMYIWIPLTCAFVLMSVFIISYTCLCRKKNNSESECPSREARGENQMPVLAYDECHQLDSKRGTYCEIPAFEDAKDMVYEEALDMVPNQPFTRAPGFTSTPREPQRVNITDDGTCYDTICREDRRGKAWVDPPPVESGSNYGVIDVEKYKQRPKYGRPVIPVKPKLRQDVVGM